MMDFIISGIRSPGLVILYLFTLNWVFFFFSFDNVSVFSGDYVSKFLYLPQLLRDFLMDLGPLPLISSDPDWFSANWTVEG